MGGMGTILSPLTHLNDGHRIPQLGLGVYKIADAKAEEVVGVALDSGYRHIDTAVLYRNEVGVGRGIAGSSVPREDVFVTTKVWNDQQGYDSTLRAFDDSLERLGLDYVDLYLIHWPAPAQDLYVETYRAMERLREEGRARSIGVSNFHIHHLQRLAAETEVVPAVNQVELHPWLPQTELRRYHREHGIRTEAWSPLARGRILDDPLLMQLADRHGVSIAQVVLRWHIQLGNIVIPKSETPERIRSNIDVFRFELQPEDMEAIETLQSGYRTGKDPDDVD